MSMARLTDDERAFFEESDSLTNDGDGHTVLRGLSYEETQAYLDHWRRQLARHDHDERSRNIFLSLHRRHLRALGLSADH